jgi:transposase-like protein
VLRLCATERDAFLVSVQLSRLSYASIAARIGVSKQAVHKWREQGVPHARTRAFCNATGSLLVIQFRELQKAIRVAQGRVREVDRIAFIASQCQEVA